MAPTEGCHVRSLVFASNVIETRRGSPLRLC